MFKTRADILKAVRRRFDAGIVRVEVTDDASWPLGIALGRPSSDELASHMDEVSAYVVRLRTWEQQTRFVVHWAARQAGGAQKIPTHVVVESIDVAARMLGREAQRELERMRGRARTLRALFRQLDEDGCARVLRASRTWTDVDFELLVQAGAWFGAHDATGLTPRQVPLPGFHAKWLNARGRQGLVALLAGKEDLGLTDSPSVVEFAYLDPVHLASGGRRYDSYVEGDTHALPYEPRVVIIVENRDSYLYFPAVEGGVCVFGSGFAGAAHVGRLPWIARVPHLLYWGDMDADGLQILDAYRAQGLNVQSILMDLASYHHYERFGTSQATGKQALESRVRKDLAHLTPDEQALYELLIDPDTSGYRRVEQERIPLEDARAVVSEAIVNDAPDYSTDG